MLNNRNKVILLVAGFLLILICSYVLAFKKTLAQRSVCKKMAVQLEAFEEVSDQLYILRAKEMHYDSILKVQYHNGRSLQNSLLNTLNQQASTEKIKLINFNSPHEYSTSLHHIKTFTFELGGSYTSILRAIYNLEQHSGFGEVIHAEFNTRKNYKSGRTNLEARIFLQRWQ